MAGSPQLNFRTEKVVKKPKKRTGKNTQVFLHINRDSQKI
ncbi:hypothetical protein D931_02258 [Enterococcus faecium 13.SD.W.09]|nr:hypothetical protein D931_02258 [Enterococcus faecium 13.SD.W.09]